MGAGYKHDTTWTLLGTAATSVANGTGVNFGEISNAGKVNTEISVSVTYGAGSVSANLVILPDIDGTNYVNPLGAVRNLPIPAFASGTREVVYDVGGDTSKFRVRIENNGAAALTATIRYRQATFGE